MRSPSSSTGFACALALCGCVGYRTPLDEIPVQDAGVPCVPGGFALAHAEPTVMFVLDRSASMDTAMTGGRNSPTRWQALGEALANVLPPVDNAMVIGALLFPTAASGNLNCGVAIAADLPPGIGNVASLVGLMSSSSPGGATPTAMALDSAAQLVLGLRTATFARALILATDGAPNCNANLNVATCRCTAGSGAATRACPNSLECLDDIRAVTGIAKHAAQGLPTYVIGIQSQGDVQFADVLNAMALAGGRPRVAATESYYAVSSETELSDALSAIRDQVGACTFLTSSVPDPNGSIVLSLDGFELPPEQWTWGNLANGEIVLSGDACLTAAAERYPTLTAVVQCTSG
jgi:hypothetical protein